MWKFCKSADIFQESVKISQALESAIKNLATQINALLSGNRERESLQAKIEALESRIRNMEKESIDVEKRFNKIQVKFDEMDSYVKSSLDLILNSRDVVLDGLKKQIKSMDILTSKLSAEKVISTVETKKEVPLKVSLGGSASGGGETIDSITENMPRMTL